MRYVVPHRTAVTTQTMASMGGEAMPRPVSAPLAFGMRSYSARRRMRNASTPRYSMNTASPQVITTIEPVVTG